jgi:hypothetical protein
MAVFEASKASLRALDLILITSDPAALAITARTETTLTTWSREFALAMREADTVTELTFSTRDRSLFRNHGNAHVLLNKLAAQNDAEIGKMFDEGRIARPDPMVHKMGQSPQPAAAVAPKTVEKKPSNAGNWVFRVLAGLAALWLINTDAGSDFLASIFGGLGVETDITKYDCDKLAKLTDGQELLNVFGGKFKVISVGPLKQVEKTETTFACAGDLILNTGKTQVATIRVKKMPNEEIFYSVE